MRWEWMPWRGWPCTRGLWRLRSCADGGRSRESGVFVCRSVSRLRSTLEMDSRERLPATIIPSRQYFLMVNMIAAMSMIAAAHTNIPNPFHIFIWCWSSLWSIPQSPAGMKLKIDVWAARLGYSSAAVTVGVILEVFEVVHELKWYAIERFNRAFMRGAVHKKEAPAWFALAGAVGLLLVIVGVGGEWISEGIVSNTDTAIRQYDENALAVATRQAGSAKDSAEAAKTDASAAKTASDAAVKQSSKATGSATQALAEADTFEIGIVSANENAAKAERDLAGALRQAAQAEKELNSIQTPRSLTNLARLDSALVPFKGTEYTINVFQDEESIELATELDGVLQKAGWVRKQPINRQLGITVLNFAFIDGSKGFVNICIETGIQLHIRTPRTLEALRSLPSQETPKSALAAIGLRAALSTSISPANERNIGKGLLVDPPTKENEPMSICVGKKP